MKKTLGIMMVMVMVIAIGLGTKSFIKTDIGQKYLLAGMAMTQGATKIAVDDDGVSFLLGQSYITYYNTEYGINQLRKLAE